jgi:hypothetical protein
MNCLAVNIAALATRRQKGLQPAVSVSKRLPGTRYQLVTRLTPKIYSQRFNSMTTRQTWRALEFADGKLPSNYGFHSPAKQRRYARLWRSAGKRGGRVQGTFPPNTLGAALSTGTKGLRFNDPRGVVVGLRPRARQGGTLSGFVVHQLS